MSALLGASYARVILVGLSIPAVRRNNEGTHLPKPVKYVQNVQNLQRAAG